ncbi:short chain dehydrogenase domain-containing protein [Ditylenchus destructor]|uniref:Short chain dehydrogenase domain-containing protein n=1 Tax=Ditylenchus destructor TaxID=166010 RepID=A0AAD4N9Z3_9BILA|nr:short chain dehydrogenase domain-containing protein [Ditylenchus destructor]
MLASTKTVAEQYSAILTDSFHECVRIAQPYLPYVLPPIGLYGLYKFLCYLIPGPQHQAKLNLKDRSVLITGASAGLGRALAFAFYSRGAKVILVARSIDKLQELCNELEDAGRKHGWQNPHRPAFRYLDLTELNGEGEGAKQIDDLRLLAIDGKTIDILVNNAGLSSRGSCSATPMSVQRQVMEVNYFGHVAVTRTLLDAVPDDGAIITVNSLQGKFALPYRSAYCASKHAMQAFCDSLRSEERHNLQILVVSSGYINTGFGSRALDTQGKPMGVQDPNQLKGMSPEYVAQQIVTALINRKTELMLAPFHHRMVPYLRLVAPNLIWWLLFRRAKKEIENQKKIAE